MEFAPGAGARIRRSFVIDQQRMPGIGPPRRSHVSVCPLPAGGRGRYTGHRLSSSPINLPRGWLRAASACVALLAVMLAACATPQAADFGGRWRAVNRFADAPQAIPLQQAYVFQASPADGTLKSMLSRWARDARMTLSYQHPNDYTLHGPVGGIRTTSLEQAASALSSAYSGHGVHVLVDRTQIIVSQGLPDGPPAAAGRDG